MLTASLADSYLEGIRAFNVAFTATIIHLISHTQMFFVPAARNAIKSSSIQELEVSPLHNQALVTYKSGNQYLYSNIDEDAMFDILFHNVESFGKWVNKFCKAEGVAVFPIAA